MPTSKRSDKITPQTATLLREGEGQRVDFKKTPDGINAEDFVAFANSTTGGSILAGIGEQNSPNGAQIGAVRGCDVSDATILQITNKALSCIPPVAIEVSTENLKKEPFLRIHIPSSSTKPHCTPKGVYCLRDGNRNRALQPNELLKIFLESEARAFAERFESSANRITKELGKLEKSLDSSIHEMSSQLGWADYKLGDTESTLDNIQAHIQRINAETNDLTSRMRELFRQDKRHDPIFERERKKFLEQALEQLLKDTDLHKEILKGQSVSIQAQGKAAEELSKDDMTNVFREAVKAVSDKMEQKKYSIEVKPPKDCAPTELHAAVQLIAEGGEVAAGIEQRLKTAAALGFVFYEKNIVGTAGLKKPTDAYRQGVFEKSEAELLPSEFTLELGWVFLKKENRSKGQIETLISRVLEKAGKKSVFATTRTNNEKMQRILQHHKFAVHGKPYQSAQNPDEKIQLFVRTRAN